LYLGNIELKKMHPTKDKERKVRIKIGWKKNLL